MWPGVVTVPTMAVGGSDGRYLRVAGILRESGILSRSRGSDERLLVRSFYGGQAFLYEFVKTLSQ
jgi:hypothetical protein